MLFPDLSTATFRSMNSGMYLVTGSEKDSLFLPKTTPVLKALAMINALKKPYPNPYFIDKKNKIIVIDAKIFKKKNYTRNSKI